MRRRMIMAIAFLLVAAIAWALWPQRSESGSTRYTNVSVDLGAASTAAANRACPQVGHAKLVCLANALKAAVSPELRNKLQRPYLVADARRWSNFPPVGYADRVGLTLGNFDPVQRAIIKAMLKEAAGIARNEGYDELEQILNADDYLKTNTPDQAGFASGNFHIAFLGIPAPKGIWELYFGGHHTAFANTYRDGRLVGATPSFRGVEPFTRFRMNGRDNAPMAQEQAAFAAMLSALDPAQRKTAKLDQIFTDIVAGPQRDDDFPRTREGVRVGDLSPGQRALVLRAISTYVGDVDPANAAAIMRRYEAELANSHVAFSGTPTMNAENDYVRVDGPSIWIEFSMQPGRSIPGIHPHSIWRDRRSDYAGNK